MKQYLAILALGLILIGCSKNGPVDSGMDSASQAEAMFSELSMYNTTASLSSGSAIATVTDSGGCVHDSLRNLRMLDSLKAYLSLTDDQFTQLQQIGTTLFTTLGDIRVQVHAGTISRDSAKTLVTAARATFVDSVKLILTADQLTQFETWITLYWNKPRGHGGHHGHGHGHHGGGKP